MREGGESAGIRPYEMTLEEGDEDDDGMIEWIVTRLGRADVVQLKCDIDIWCKWTCPLAQRY